MEITQSDQNLLVRGSSDLARQTVAAPQPQRLPEPAPFPLAPSGKILWFSQGEPVPPAGEQDSFTLETLQALWSVEADLLTLLMECDPMQPAGVAGERLGKLIEDIDALQKLPTVGHPSVRALNASLVELGLKVTRLLKLGFAVGKIREMPKRSSYFR